MPHIIDSALIPIPTVNSQNCLYNPVYPPLTGTTWYQFDFVDPTSLLVAPDAPRAPCPTDVVRIEAYTSLWRVELDYHVTNAFPAKQFLVPVTFRRLKKDGKLNRACNPKEFMLHCGYRRLIVELKHSIAHGQINRSGNAVFRMTYAQKIIDALANELTKRGPTKEELGWRSQVLNPILQRQLHGYMDHEPRMLAVHFAGLEGEALKKAVDGFYLSCDPLDPSQQDSIRQGILYVAEARWSLTVSSNVILLQDQNHYQQCIKNTNTLLKKLGEQSEDPRLAEVTVVVAEGLDNHFQHMYPGEIERATCERDAGMKTSSNIDG